MKDEKKKYPFCFGIIEVVFPKADDGLRITPKACLECPHKTECLRYALKESEGLKVREEFVDRAYESGMISFLDRWSKKKELSRRIKERSTKYKNN